MRVPCVIRAPGRFPGGRVCSELVTSMDLYPTFAKLAGVPLPDDRTIDGKDITPILENTPGAKSPHPFFFYHGNFGELAAVRGGKWKLHLNPVPVLYDLEADVGEKNDVIRGNGDTVAELRTAVIAFQEEMHRNTRPAGEIEPE
jgi:arylsulfatase A-like enzyme